VSAKNVTVLTLAGLALHCTRKTAKKKVERGTHRWQDEFTVLELKPHSSDSDPARFLIPRLAVNACDTGQLLDPLAWYIPWNYPVADQRSAGVRHCVTELVQEFA
jgi:hypothetical protein